MNVGSSLLTASVNIGNSMSTLPASLAGDRIMPVEVARELQRAGRVRPQTGTALFERWSVPDTAKVSQHEAKVELIRPVAPIAEIRERPSFVALQEWEGVVTALNDEIFMARLVDVTRRSPDEEAEFSFSELNNDDLQLVMPGAIFRWSAGVLTMPGGGKLATSQVVFRRLPKWTKRDLQRADEIARRLIEHLAPSGGNEARSAG
jgi:hypothetical protein